MGQIMLYIKHCVEQFKNGTITLTKLWDKIDTYLWQIKVSDDDHGDPYEDDRPSTLSL